MQTLKALKIISFLNMKYENTGSGMCIVCMMHVYSSQM